ncbi:MULTISPECIES: hypothetical protein [unclassified Aureimonas]|uniref:hypothetical protein n=1 Tax=unclassified Aureimonas TaxID=2615206 RepID=UPI0006F37544|nr:MULTISPECIES: hypothetical protein [unclassified Aureimonas]KQT58559.1 hypothetical protein ASG62_24590 [Aureimonas sp. Leaf427]KQT64580.1 hypothetical protein ASG54_22825 [Aureimonas sp. Leaf460]
MEKVLYILFAVATVGAFIVELIFKAPGKGELLGAVAGSAGVTIGIAILGVLLVLFARRRKKAVAGFLVLAIVLTIAGATSSVHRSYGRFYASTEANCLSSTTEADAAGEMDTEAETDAEGDVDARVAQAASPAYCTCLANEMTSPSMRVLATNWIQRGTKEDAVSRIEMELYPEAAANCASLQPAS